MAREITTRNDAILDGYQPFVVATPANMHALEMSPFGVDTRWVVDPTKLASETFVNLLQRLDALTFGPEGMPMDKWVFYNCSELTGFIYGFACPAAELSGDERELFGVPGGYEGPVPFSMYIAIPMFEEGAWFGHNLASLNRTFPHRQLFGLGTITKAMALKAYRVQRFYGATQWKSRALYVHVRFGPLDLYTAYTPAHSLPETLTYGFEVSDDKLRHAAGDPSVALEFPEPDRHLHADDIEGMQALQREIEGGARYAIAGAPAVRGGMDAVLPIARLG